MMLSAWKHRLIIQSKIISEFQYKFTISQILKNGKLDFLSYSTRDIINDVFYLNRLAQNRELINDTFCLNGLAQNRALINGYFCLNGLVQNRELINDAF